MLAFGSEPHQDVLAIRSIRWEVTGLTRDRWRQCKEVLIAIVLCGARGGCYASRGALIDVANRNAPPEEPIIGSVATFKRVMGKLVERELATQDKQSNLRGNAPMFRQVVREGLEKLVAESQKLAQDEREIAGESAPESGASSAQKRRIKTDENPEKNASREPHLSRTWTAPEPHPPYYSTSSSSSTSLTETKNHTRSTVDHGFVSNSRDPSWTEDTIAGFCDWVAHIEERIGPCKCFYDRSLLVKAVHLAHTTFNINWLMDSVQGVLTAEDSPSNKFAYLHDCLREKAKEDFGKVLNRELARLKLPIELLESRKTTAVDLSARMCGTGRES